MKKVMFFLLILLTGVMLEAQQKYALVIGNSAYIGISTLTNPENDAVDMEAALQSLGFTVDKILNGNLDQMERAIMNFRWKLSASPNSYGFFFYAGHGIQYNGENYLIPVDASNILSENHLRQRAVSVQTILDNLNAARNILNMIVLDACRDNPFGWNRSGSRGLSVISRIPTGSIIMYATAVNDVAADGTGRNGLFTGQLLNSLKTEGLSVLEVLNKTGEGVIRASGGRQHPELRLNFFGAANTYLGTRPSTGSGPLFSQAPVNFAKDHFDKGELFRERKDWDIAILEYTEAIKFDPNYVAAYHSRGSAYLAKSDYDQAIVDYSTVIRLNPNHIDAYLGRAKAYSGKAYNQFNSSGYQVFSRNDLDNFDRAIADCSVVIGLDPSNFTAYNYRGSYCFDKSEYDRAIADFTEAIRLNPNDGSNTASLYYKRALAHSRKGEWAKANADQAKYRELMGANYEWRFF